MRTRFSDDRLWLVYATLQYARPPATRRSSTSRCRFSRARLLNAGRARVYERPRSRARRRRCTSTACALARASRPDARPAADGLGRLERRDEPGRSGGPGESVWLGWFFAALLGPFAALAERAASTIVRRVSTSCLGLAEALDAHGTATGIAARTSTTARRWDRQNAECRIDSIAQSWAVISGAAADRARQAMESIDVTRSPDDGIVLLLTPPFDKTTPSPGYIQGYLPGVRENGGSLAPRRSGPFSRLRASVTATARPSSSRC